MAHRACGLNLKAFCLLSQGACLFQILKRRTCGVGSRVTSEALIPTGECAHYHNSQLGGASKRGLICSAGRLRESRG